ncbi:unnamed protein product [Colias eurytheme]|nr:unnamed protein product [Colias eurytheme]
MSLWPAARPLFGDEVVLRSIDWLENFPWRNESSMRSENSKYEIRMNLKDFKPEEITIKTTDGFIVVEGKQEEKKDEHGYVSRHFVRKYAIPEGVKAENVESRLTVDGVLVIAIPRKEKNKRDTIIPVTHEGVKSKL